MKNYKYIIFDLDGTLTDSSLGITNAIAQSLEKLGMPPVTREELYCFIGPPLVDSYKKHMNMDDETITEAVKIFREYYNSKGKFENRVYDGIEEALKALAHAGKKLYVATSKPQHFARQILEHFNILQYFDYVAGATPDEIQENARTTKEEVLLYLFFQEHIDTSSAVLIGDTMYDAIGAKDTGIDCIGVTFGFGSAEELIENGAVTTADSTEDLIKILL